jgi:hypothetical protein
MTRRVLTRHLPTRRILPILAACLVAAGVATDAPARGFRSFDAIATPSALPEGATRPERLHPVDPELVRQGVRRIIAAWNRGQLDRYLADDFQDRSQLLDSFAVDLPKDLRIRILNIRGIQTLDQWIKKGDDGDWQVSRVNALVRTQIEFNSVKTGFQRLEGDNEYTIEVRERLP